eukprot:CAMPEP_0183436040 /NCGR_PEP_ID=MMETSP0370-20130417/69007_1 /TAXON_ID=268820 /ORGANISM="Peridinium aciculiferum, Strain PAER-2" /LENGTH=676 /DNA_ID=CAMNT_0025623363 /DNA_START=70 /DNA_END=2100 /DNA_ORIENTATION=-
MVQLVAKVFLLCATGAAGLADADFKERPVMKVVRLLQDMKAELQKDLDDDKAVHGQLDCWCKSNDKDKTAAIVFGEAKESQLTSELGEAAAKMDELKTKRDATLDEVNKDEASLHEASTLRMKENQEFHAEEVNLVEAVKACAQAVTVLGKHNAGFAQVRAIAQQLQAAQVMELGRHSVQPSDMLALRSFLLKAQDSSPSFLQIPGMQSYAPQSGQIFGVLKQMQEDFEKDLSEAQAKDKKAGEDYASLKAAKEAEIVSGRTLQAELDQNIAELKEKHAQAFQELEDTEAQLDLDRTFLANLKEKCAASDTEFDQRVKDRLEEIVAVEDTIKILNDDEAFSNFDKTVNSFLQTISSTTMQERLNRATAVLIKAAAATGAPELALLASRAKLDAFTKVKEEIDKMVIQLKKQQQDEIEHRDWCIDELNKNNRSSEESYDMKASLETKIADLEKTIEYLNKEIEATTAAVAEMQNQMKRAGENREAENGDYAQTVSDQRMTQMILEKALARMKQVYAMIQEDQPGAPHIATSGTHTDPGNAPARFTKYDKHAGGSRVVSMIETVIADSRKTEDEAIAAEQDAQNAYENFMKDSNKAITVYTEKIMSMKGAEAKAREDFTMAEADHKATFNTLEELHATSGDLHKSCDFVLDTFDARQAARTAEVDALGEAKAILSGMN